MSELLESRAWVLALLGMYHDLTVQILSRVVPGGERAGEGGTGSVEGEQVITGLDASIPYLDGTWAMQMSTFVKTPPRHRSWTLTICAFHII